MADPLLTTEMMVAEVPTEDEHKRGGMRDMDDMGGMGGMGT